ncbi:hypothetical protein IOD16_23990 [Saccharothrix sp. 6-C]|uniref:hypothetical protein n=1 Tax=Saccharothrix sp. 6-C TaxID=2781735 RepID=UPI0019178D09|nr:hypothetical protein [Saccharothrix sp. 6-C]QQQ74251.1 hypothetical protein IOD16_23990 [Saccharothrix sp. 6-C]
MMCAHRRLTAALLVALLSVIAAPGARAQPTHRAAEALTTCAGTNTVRFDPGLRLLPRQVGISGSGAYDCASTDPAITSGTSVVTGSGALGCLTSDGSTTEVITWNTGEQSRLAYTFALIVQPGGEAVVVVVGSVEAGKFAGSPIASPGAQVTLTPLRCLTDTGVELITGPSTLLIG